MSTANLDAYNLSQVDVNGLIREDVMNKIWDISKIPLPFTDMIGTGSHGNEHKEWTQDELQAVNVNNATIDGDDIDQDDTNTGLRVGNHSQTSVKEVKVSTRAIESNTIGRANELSYQVTMRQQELKRDMEAQMLTNQASVPGTDSVAGISAGLNAWIASNAIGGVGFVAGGFQTGTGIVNAATLGTPEALTEEKVRDTAQAVYQEGGNPTIAMCVPSVARGFSEYLFTSSARVATLTAETNQKGPAKAVGSVSTFIGDFGLVLEITPNRLQQNTATDASTMFLIDSEHLEQSFLHSPRVEPLAKTGLSDKRLMSADYTLCVGNEKGLGAINDIDNNAPVTQV